MSSTAIGALWPESASSSYPIKNRVGLREAAFLAGLGMAAVCLHAAGRGLVEMPGHQGLGWIGLLVAGRRRSQYRWAAVTSSVGAASLTMMPWWSFNDPFRWLTYLLAGVTLDVLYTGFCAFRRNPWLLALGGGLAHMTKPLARVGFAQLKGWPYGSLRWGVAYPAASHFMFGFVGALVSLGLMALARRWGANQTNPEGLK